MRGADSNGSAVIVLCLLGCDIWTTGAKTPQEYSDAKGMRHAVNIRELITSVCVYKELDRYVYKLFFGGCHCLS